jgi:hypothetical protein
MPSSGSNSPSAMSILSNNQPHAKWRYVMYIYVLYSTGVSGVGLLIIKGSCRISVWSSPAPCPSRPWFALRCDELPCLDAKILGEARPGTPKKKRWTKKMTGMNGYPSTLQPGSWYFLAKRSHDQICSLLDCIVFIGIARRIQHINCFPHSITIPSWVENWGPRPQRIFITVGKPWNFERDSELHHEDGRSRYFRPRTKGIHYLALTGWAHWWP